MVSKAFGLLCGSAMLVGLAVSTPASAQRNPFMPNGGASKAEVERIIDERLKSLEDRLSKSKAAAPAAGTPGTPIPGAAGTPTASGPGSPIPGSPAAGPLSPGAGAPGGIAPYGSPNGASGMPSAPQGAVAEARSADVRFLGCINGAPKFVKKTTGERVVFTTREINDAVKSGTLPACR
jgi:hypothetical protein